MDQPQENNFDHSPDISEAEPVVPETKDTLPYGPQHDDLDWQQVHKATPFIRGWLIIVAIVFGGLNSFGGGFSEDSEQLEFAKWEILGVLGAGVIGLIIAVVYGYFAWRRMRYAYDDESVYMKSGIFFRQERKIRLDRIQSIDIVKPLLARIFGLAELTLTSASGGDANVAIGFLKEEHANQLRIEILARASGVAADRRAQALAARNAAATSVAANTNPASEGVLPTNGASAAGALPDGFDVVGSTQPEGHPAGLVENQEILLEDLPERVIYQVPPTRVVVGAILTAGTIVTVLLALAAIILFVLGQRGIALSMLPILLGIGPMAVGRLIGEFGFTGAISPDGIRVRHGLLETRSKTIPPGRVQAVRIRQGLLWRKLGWWRVDVNLAGQAVDVNGSVPTLEAVLLPVGTSVEAIDALWLVLPDLGVQNPLEALDASMTGTGTDQGFVVSPRSARWLDPLSYKRNGYLVTDRAVIIRTGWLNRSVIVVPHERVQSIGAKQGPLQRKLDVATFSIHSTVGAIMPMVPHQSAENVRQLLAEQSARASMARINAGPERWLQQVVELSQEESLGNQFGRGALHSVATIEQNVLPVELEVPDATEPFSEMARETELQSGTQPTPEQTQDSERTENP